MRILSKGLTLEAKFPINFPGAITSNFHASNLSIMMTIILWQTG